MKKVSETGKHNTLDYEERAGNYIDFAEDMFEQYCQDKGMKYRRLHLNDTPDFATSPIPLWNKMHPVLKSFPDYFVYNDKEHFFCEIKSNYKIKITDLKHYNLFDSMFCENYATKYYIVFCIRNADIVFKTVDDIGKALSKSKLEQYHDGPYYYKLNF